MPINYSVFNVSSELLEKIFSKPNKILNDHLIKLINRNSELMKEATVVPFGFKYNGRYFFNPSITFSKNKDNLCNLHESLEDSVMKFMSDHTRIIEDTKLIQSFVVSQTYNAESDSDFFNKLPNDFDIYIKKMSANFQRQIEPEIRPNLVNLYNKVLEKLNIYLSYEVIT